MVKLYIGCHCGTVVSRGSEVREFDTLEQAKESYIESKKVWDLIGYMVWFAYVKDEIGNIMTEWPNSSYT